MMEIDISKKEARNLAIKLQSVPNAPGPQFSHLINVGTEDIIDSLDENYFEFALADGIGCFKYLEAGYGYGKTQFIESLSERASKRGIVTSLVTVDAECPFNSPAAIYRAIMGNFQPNQHDPAFGDKKGIEVLIRSWIKKRIIDFGANPDGEVPSECQMAIESQFEELLIGLPDMQTATAMKHLTSRLLKLACGASSSEIDPIVIGWLRGDQIRSNDLRKIGLFEPALDNNAFKRLKTVITFLRKQMDYQGFLIAFDEGTRTNSFRRGTVKQKQAIENLLTMINQNTDGGFGGVMFLYAATPDFRNETISQYTALQDRIGTESFSEGSPQVPLIKLDVLVTDEILHKIGERLLAVYSIAYDIEWDMDLQLSNIKSLVEAQKNKLFETPYPRFFVYQCCRFLNLQRKEQSRFNDNQFVSFVDNNEFSDESEIV